MTLGLLNEEITMSTKNEITETLSSQIKRARELYAELEDEIRKDLRQSKVSSRTSEITEDILTKLRNCLDKGINQYWEAKGNPSSKHLYFPICQDKNQFADRLNEYGLGGIQNTDPQLYALLLSVQPFTSTMYAILNEVNELGSKQKHHSLTVQEKQVVDERTTVSNQNGAVVNWSSKYVRFETDASVLGVPINLQTQMPSYIPTGYSLKTEKFISICFSGRNTDVLQFCKQAIDVTESITNQLIGIC